MFFSFFKISGALMHNMKMSKRMWIFVILCLLAEQVNCKSGRVGTSFGRYTKFGFQKLFWGKILGVIKINFLDQNLTFFHKKIKNFGSKGVTNTIFELKFEFFQQ